MESIEYEIMICHGQLRFNRLEAAQRIYYLSPIIKGLFIIIDTSLQLVSRFESDINLAAFKFAFLFTFIFTKSN